MEGMSGTLSDFSGLVRRECTCFAGDCIPSSLSHSSSPSSHLKSYTFHATTSIINAATSLRRHPLCPHPVGHSTSSIVTASLLFLSAAATPFFCLALARGCNTGGLSVPVPLPQNHAPAKPGEGMPIPVGVSGPPAGVVVPLVKERAYDGGVGVNKAALFLRLRRGNGDGDIGEVGDDGEGSVWCGVGGGCVEGDIPRVRR